MDTDDESDFSALSSGSPQPFVSLELWHDGLGYHGWGAQLREGETREPRLRLLELESLLVLSGDEAGWSNWVDVDIVVKVFPHGLYDDANSMPWPGHFDLATASGSLCVLLQGEAARSYLGDAARIGDDYQHRYKTFFEDEGILYSVHAMPVVPGQIERAGDLPGCSDGIEYVADPTTQSWLWSLRDIDEYELTFRVECAACDPVEYTIDGSIEVLLPAWPRFSSIENLYWLAMSDEYALVRFSTDGLVGVPIDVEVVNPDTGGSLRLIATSFMSDYGRIDVEHDDLVGASLIRTGFDDWTLEGY